jgi:protein TonB
MNGEQKSFLLSILMHVFIGVAIYLIGTPLVHRVKTIVVDLTISPEVQPTGLLPAKGTVSPVPKKREAPKPAEVLSKPEAQARIKEAYQKVHEPESPSGPGRVTTVEMPSPGQAGSITNLSNSTQSAGSGSPKHAALYAEAGKSLTGGTGSQGKSQEQLRAGYLKEHFAYIKDIIQKNIVYPPRARRMGWAGRVVVSFIINESGRTSNERIVESSGFDVLDGNVIETVRAVSPFPKPPVKAELRVPIIYRLE